jgi:hypothetical protein
MLPTGVVLSARTCDTDGGNDGGVQLLFLRVSHHGGERPSPPPLESAGQEILELSWQITMSG